MMIDELFLKEGDSLKTAVEVIDRGSVQIALVVDADKRLLGTITDGDIRRALLRGQNLDCPASGIMQRNFHALPVNATDAQALATMRKETLRQIPVLDAQGRVVRLFLLNDLIKPQGLANIVVLMAGGEGKRLRPLTQDCPKPMLCVGGKPILETILEQCIDAGFRDFFIAVNYLKEQIKDHFSQGERWNVNIRYLEENQALGTAGALSLLPQGQTESILVMNGDILTRVDFKHLLCFHAEHDADATLCVREHTTQIPYGVVYTEDLEVQTLQEKPMLSHYVNAGIYLLKPKLLDLLPRDSFYDMPQLLEAALQRQHRVLAFPIHEYWLDIGHHDTLERAHCDW